MQKQKAKITLPSYAEIKYQKPLLSDYAIATGARCNPLGAKYQNGVRMQSGVNWVRNAVDHSADLAAVYNHAGNLSYAYAGDRTIAIMPRIVNPKALGFGTQMYHGESVLTYQDRLVTYPKPHTNAALSDDLTLALIFEKRDLREIGECLSDDAPLTTARNGYSWEDFQRTAVMPYHPKVNRRFAYHGKDYVFLEGAHQFDQNSIFSDGVPCVEGAGYWFDCEPVRAGWCADGCIQLYDSLLAGQFEAQNRYQKRKCKKHQLEVDPDKFGIGQFLNGDLLQDLIASTRNPRERQVQSYRKLKVFKPELDADMLKPLCCRYILRQESGQNVLKRDILAIQEANLDNNLSR